MGKCPKCGGTNGYFFSWVERVNSSGMWGEPASEAAQDFDLLSANKFAVCVDCGKRVLLEDARRLTPDAADGADAPRPGWLGNINGVGADPDVP